ncbi:MAG: OmpA family protein [Hyphomicrobium sp.]|jgi:outer membrane protein OmpA-like peptidoglycan-associated protein
MRRISTVLLVLLFSTSAALVAATQLEIDWPWSISRSTTADPTTTDPARKDDHPLAPDAAAEKSAARTTEAALADLGKTVAGTRPAAGDKPQIDVSRISPNGVSVFAGQAKPNTFVTVLENDTPIGTVKSDANGEWSIVTEHRFASADPKVTLRMDVEPPRPVAELTKPSPNASGPVSGPVANAKPLSPASAALQKFEAVVAEARSQAAKENEPGNEAKSKNDSTTVQPAGSSAALTPETKAPDASPSQRLALANGAATPAPSGTAGPAGPATGLPRPSEAARAPALVSIPVPIMFVYNGANLTPEGERAAKLLLEYVKLKRLASLSLSGHADERGTDAYNIDLSRERLGVVAKLLRDGGYAGALDLIPKGKAEPYKGVDRTKYSGETLYQLDRRVELRFER